MIAVLLLAALLPPSQGLTLQADAPWMVSPADYDNNQPLTLALRDLEKDWHAVLGFRPMLLTAAPPTPVASNASAVVVSSLLLGVASADRALLHTVQM